MRTRTDYLTTTEGKHMSLLGAAFAYKAGRNLTEGYAAHVNASPYLFGSKTIDRFVKNVSDLRLESQVLGARQSAAIRASARFGVARGVGVMGLMALAGYEGIKGASEGSTQAMVGAGAGLAGGLALGGLAGKLVGPAVGRGLPGVAATLAGGAIGYLGARTAAHALIHDPSGGAPGSSFRT